MIGGVRIFVGDQTQAKEFWTNAMGFGLLRVEATANAPKNRRLLHTDWR
jgi:hypothetical protein